MITFTARKFEEMKKVLMDENVSGPLETYFMIKNPGQNVTIISPIMLGREFNKTYGHYHKPHFPEKYTLLYGKGAVLMQKLKNPNDYYNDVAEIKFVKLNLNEEFLIPQGFGHILVNLGNTLLITRDDWNDKNAQHLYTPIAEKRGMGYYVIKKESGEVGFEKNPNYSNLPELTCL
ncbi:hypothetical protein KJ678_00300 [Patescibacteria group bacterium]|nr:hypothetical protein [Patescibacteria group bacterium]